MKPGTKNSFKSLSQISISGKNYKYFSLREAEKNGLEGISKLPKSIKVLLENLLRYEDDLTVNKKQIKAIKKWLTTKKSDTEIAYRPARVLLQDYTGIPAVADLAAMREAVKEKNKDPNTINPLSSVDLVNTTITGQVDNTTTTGVGYTTTTSGTASTTSVNTTTSYPTSSSY